MSHKPRILVVEDEILIATDISYSLRSLGYTVLGIRSSGEEALAAVGELNPDVVTLDITLKGKMDGIETGYRIREGFGIPFIYLTAHSDEATRKRAMATGPCGYVLKPFEESDLRTAIAHAVNGRDCGT